MNIGALGQPNVVTIQHQGKVYNLYYIFPEGKTYSDVFILQILFSILKAMWSLYQPQFWPLQLLEHLDQRILEILRQLINLR